MLPPEVNILNKSSSVLPPSPGPLSETSIVSTWKHTHMQIYAVCDWVHQRNHWSQHLDQEGRGKILDLYVHIFRLRKYHSCTSHRGIYALRYMHKLITQYIFRAYLNVCVQNGAGRLNALKRYRVQVSNMQKTFKPSSGVQLHHWIRKAGSSHVCRLKGHC